MLDTCLRPWHPAGMQNSLWTMFFIGASVMGAYAPFWAGAAIAIGAGIGLIWVHRKEIAKLRIRARTLFISRSEKWPAAGALKLPDTAKALVVLFLFGFIVLGILPPILWPFMPTFTPFLSLLYIFCGIALSHDVLFAFLFHQKRLHVVHIARMVIGLMMIAMPAIMKNWSAEVGGVGI